MSWIEEAEREAQQPTDPRESEKGVAITVTYRQDAAWDGEKKRTVLCNRWALRDGVLILIRSEPGGRPDRTHIPLTSILEWEVKR